jgi:hypothetical protein
LVAASAGAAKTEAASSAAEMVLSMFRLLLTGIREAGRMAGLADHACNLAAAALNRP